MGKLVIKFQGKIVSEVGLKLGDTKIGRKAGCDIVLEDPAVSGEHAVVKTVGMKSMIQDLDSKNGTYVETQRVKQHELRHGQTVIIGGYSLMYRDDTNLDVPAFGQHPAAAAVPHAAHNVTTELVSVVELVAVEGKDKGKRVPLIKDTVELDNPGRSPARVSRTRDGYVLEASIGPGEPKLNGKPIRPGGELLENGDMVEIAGTVFRFSR